MILGLHWLFVQSSALWWYTVRTLPSSSRLQTTGSRRKKLHARRPMFVVSWLRQRL